MDVAACKVRRVRMFRVLGGVSPMLSALRVCVESANRGAAEAGGGRREAGCGEGGFARAERSLCDCAVRLGKLGGGRVCCA